MFWHLNQENRFRCQKNMPEFWHLTYATIPEALMAVVMLANGLGIESAPAH